MLTRSYVYIVYRNAIIHKDMMITRSWMGMAAQTGRPAGSSRRLPKPGPAGVRGCCRQAAARARLHGCAGGVLSNSHHNFLPSAQGQVAAHPRYCVGQRGPDGTPTPHGLLLLGKQATVAIVAVFV